MRLQILAVGKPRGVIAEGIRDYETRAARYFSLETAEVREEPYRREGDATRVREAEGHRLLERVGQGLEIVALHETGRQWASPRVAEYLQALALDAAPGAAFLIGGAYGLSDAVLSGARHTLSLSAMTLTHEMARLVLAEQLYRAGTILRGEPYHKGRE